MIPRGQRRDARDALDTMTEAMLALNRTGVPMHNAVCARAADDIDRAVRDLRTEIRLEDRAEKGRT